MCVCHLCPLLYCFVPMEFVSLCFYFLKAKMGERTQILVEAVQFFKNLGM